MIHNLMLFIIFKLNAMILPMSTITHSTSPFTRPDVHNNDTIMNNQYKVYHLPFKQTTKIVNRVFSIKAENDLT